MIAKLEHAISIAGPRLISVDCFDTVLLRSYEPAPVRMRSAAHRFAKILAANGSAVAPEAIFAARITASRAAFNLAHVLDDIDDVPLDRIFELTLDALGLDRKYADAMITAELDEEIDRLRINEQVVRLLKRCRDSGQRIALTSDTSLSAIELARLLAAFRIADLFDKIRSSADYGKTKASGRLFRIIIDEEGLDPAQIFHFGDDLTADFTRPTDLGIKAMQTPRGYLHATCTRAWKAADTRVSNILAAP